MAESSWLRRRLAAHGLDVVTPTSADDRSRCYEIICQVRPLPAVGRAACNRRALGSQPGSLSDCRSSPLASCSSRRATS
jgi:hypothetical protein